MKRSGDILNDWEGNIDDCVACSTRLLCFESQLRLMMEYTKSTVVLHDLKFVHNTTNYRYDRLFSIEPREQSPDFLLLASQKEVRR